LPLDAECGKRRKWFKRVLLLAAASDKMYVRREKMAVAKIILPKVIKVPSPVGGGVMSLGIGARPAAKSIGSDAAQREADATAEKAREEAEYKQFLAELEAQRLSSARTELERKYNESVSGLNDVEAGIGSVYQAAKNRASATSAMEKQNVAEFTNARGLNSGTMVQSEIVRSSELSGTLGALERAEADAYAELERQYAKLYSDYMSGLESEEAEYALKKAEELYKESVSAKQEAQSKALSKSAELLSKIVGRIAV
jgi:hypothetical protein